MMSVGGFNFMLIVFIWQVIGLLTSSAQGFDHSETIHVEGAPAMAPGAGLHVSEKGITYSYFESGEKQYSPSFYMTSDDGYWFFGLANTNGNPPRMLDSPDPAITYPPVSITSILMGRFKGGPLGDLDFVEFIIECNLDYNGRKLFSGIITQAWASNPAYCGPDGPIKDRCHAGTFKWTPIDASCQTLEIYDPDDPTKLLLGFERLCRSLPISFLLNSTWWLPRLSAYRLISQDTFVPITKGLTEDGKPKIVDHVFGDFDMDVIFGIASFDRITGPEALKLIGFTFPIGVSVLYGTIRWGYFYISPYQRSFAVTAGNETIPQQNPLG
eukprot:jgi/Botrbrau1/17881/Bobra.0717s0004.1